MSVFREVAVDGGAGPGLAHADAQKNSFGRTHPSLAKFVHAIWYRHSVRAQILIVLVFIHLIAVLGSGAVTILEARKSTRIEIAASMKLADGLVRETIRLMQQEGPTKLSLADLPLQLRYVRHVRIAARDAAGLPVAMSSFPADFSSTSEDGRAAAPAWFAALIAPPAETWEVPVVVRGERIGSVLIVAEPSDEIAEVWENTVALASLALLVSLVVIGLLYVLLGRVLDPLTRLAGGMLDLERQNFKVRLLPPKAREAAAITDRFNALAETLDGLRDENTKLNRRLVTAQDDERRHMALELHDEVGPSLFGLKANATSIASMSSELPEPAASGVKERIGDMLAIIEHVQAINRGLLNRLRPMALGHVALADLLSEIVRDRAHHCGDIAFSFTAGKLAHSYGDSIDLTIYRCLQESLTNAIRHAQATRVEVVFGETIDRISATDQNPTRRLDLTVSDDGRGIDSGTTPGFGLQGMKERVQALGGSCVIEGASGCGTTVRIAIPVPSPLAASNPTAVTAGDQK